MSRPAMPDATMTMATTARPTRGDSLAPAWRGAAADGAETATVIKALPFNGRNTHYRKNAPLAPDWRAVD